MRHRPTLLVIAIAVGGLCALWALRPPAPPEQVPESQSQEHSQWQDTRHPRHLQALAVHAGRSDEDGTLRAQLDSEFEERHGDPSDASVSSMIASVEVSDEAVESYYEKHRDRFGERGFETSKDAARKMLKIEILLGRESQ